MPPISIALATLMCFITAAAVRAGHPPPPLTLELVGPPKVVPGRELVLTLAIHRPLPSRVPMTLEVTLPPGVTLIGGEPRQLIVDARATRLERTLRLMVERVPDDDLVVSVDAQSAAQGVHARARYRFGRPEPLPVRAPLAPAVPTPDGRGRARPVMLARPPAPLLKDTRPATPKVRSSP